MSPPKLEDTMDRKALIEVLDRLKSAQKRWCAEEVDDAEEMWSDIPEMLDDLVPKMEKALGFALIEPNVSSD